MDGDDKKVDKSDDIKNPEETVEKKTEGEVDPKPFDSQEYLDKVVEQAKKKASESAKSAENIQRMLDEEKAKNEALLGKVSELIAQNEQMLSSGGVKEYIDAHHYNARHDATNDNNGTTMDHESFLNALAKGL